ncbi:uncharacterized protein N0V89_005707 [Didymosphaeria variabile]|uniref:Uncharacterized protein n=1 Tax=Didymosphaeria variabile TaxID=1932322 RepID=A0A9W9CBI4_9PLEO|nr:uncharacterized protein N0V89_005707 [Didymosphaeria variabile]KAJ4353975.1 hypothetical protein N0V89_005707 [Didymosphaeria variabile]
MTQQEYGYQSIYRDPVSSATRMRWLQKLMDFMALTAVRHRNSKLTTKAQVYNSDGDFLGFSLNIHEHAKQYGYWRFADDIENRHAIRAHNYGFRKPELLFSAYNQNARGLWHVEIKLTWYPGEKDPYQVRRTGTTGQHMANIAEERTLVGLPPLLAHEIPVRDFEILGAW